MWFGLLGALAVRHEGAMVPVSGQRRRVLLAMLLLEAGTVVPTELLIEALWPDARPSQVLVGLYNHVKRLRHTLGPQGATRLVTGVNGYAIQADEGEFDVADFLLGIQRGHAAIKAQDWARASNLLGGALELWRGLPLSDLPSRPAFADAATYWSRQRLQALRWRIEADLNLGRHAELLTELANLTEQHCFDEDLRALWMLALYRAGRQAEALRVYQDTQALLANELGVDPAPPLRELHNRILNTDPILAGPLSQRLDATHMVMPASRGTPQQLPAGVRHFVGRVEELQALHTLADDLCRASGTIVVSAIGGMPGVGKTALAVRFAHQVAHRFPDGQLYVNLRGFDPGSPPADPTTTARGFLDALGVPAERIPADTDAVLACYRSRLAGTRTLIVLDNARDAEQVRPLLPGAAGCLVLVTSRNHLTALVALDGAIALTLDQLTPAEASLLLATRLGPERIAANTQAVAELIEQCARLPLTLNIAAAHASTHPDSPLGTLTRQLRDIHQRLDRLSAGESAADVRAVFSWSYQALNPHSARVFRLLGLHPGPDISLPATASLAGVPHEQARSALEALLRAHLISERNPGRYTFHDLLRAYATELTHHHDTEDQRHAATRRMLEHYIHTAYTAGKLIDSVRYRTIPHPIRSPAIPEPLDDREHAVTWFTTEHAVLLGVIRHSDRTGFDIRTIQLAWTLESFFDFYGHWYHQQIAQEAALAAALRLGDRPAQARAHRILGAAHMRLRRFDQTDYHYWRALDLLGESGDPVSLAHNHYNIGFALQQQGHYRQALDYTRRALDLYLAADDRRHAQAALGLVGVCQAMLGHPEQALASATRSLTLYETLDDSPKQATTWWALGLAHHGLGHHQQAIIAFQRLADLHRKNGDRHYIAETLILLGDVFHDSNKTTDTRETWEQALAIFNEIDHPNANLVRAKLANLQTP